MTGALQLSRVSVSASGRTLLHGVDLALQPGELCGLIGPSGAGKSTLIKVLLGLRSTSGGQVTLGGRPVSEAGPIGYVPQDDALHVTLSPTQALSFAAELRLPTLTNEERDRRISEVLEQVGLLDRAHVRISKLSGGQRKRVSVAMELLTGPGVLILDEPTSGLDPGMEARMMDLFAEVAGAGRVVLVATHAMQSLDRCRTLVVLVAGRLVYAGAPSAAASWFGADGLNGIFARLPERSPEAWEQRWRAGPRPAASTTSRSVDPKLLAELTAQRARREQ